MQARAKMIICAGKKASYTKLAIVIQRFSSQHLIAFVFVERKKKETSCDLDKGNGIKINDSAQSDVDLVKEI